MKGKPAMGVKIRLEKVSFRYGTRSVFQDLSVDFQEHELAVIVGPSGQGKSTLLMCMNRLWEEIPGARMEGKVWITLDGRAQCVSDPSFPAPTLRRRVAMVFQTPNPLPMTIFNNVAFPHKMMGVRDRNTLEDTVRTALMKAYLWDEVKDRLHEDARHLSGGQQQRLCIARALSLHPDVVLLDEPTSSLDEKAARVIENLLLDLKPRMTVIVVSHSTDQVRRLADRVFRLQEGRLFLNGSLTGHLSS